MKWTRFLIPAFLILALGLIAYYYSQPAAKEQATSIKVPVAKGPFEIPVTATGELQAKRSVKIRGPQGMRSAGIYETTISDLVAEGTIVSEGDYVASLDRTELAGKMSNVQTEIEKIQTQLEQAKIDTAIELRGLRDQLVNLNFTKKQNRLAVEQARYEPQSVIQQAELDLERTERDYKQLEQNYSLKQKQAIAKIQEINALLKQNQMQMATYSKLSAEFNINAPKDGMVIYSRSWNGKKEPGSRLTAWDPVVAELPDLSDMISKTYVNEVDISKVKEGQDVKIKVDAFPDKEYTGQVLKVANIGEQLRGYDAKVFEVIVQVNEVDSILRPAMTTANEIITDVFEEAIFIPLESLQSDSLTYVIKDDNGRMVKQEVVTGLGNSNEVIIDFGLNENDQVYLNTPENLDDLPFYPIAEEDKAKIKKKQEEEAIARAQLAAEKLKKVKKLAPPQQDNSGGGDIIIFN